MDNPVLWCLVRFQHTKRCSVRLYLQLLVVGLMSYLRQLCSLEQSGVQHILCCVFCFVLLRLVHPTSLNDNKVCQLLTRCRRFSPVHNLPPLHSDYLLNAGLFYKSFIKRVVLEDEELDLPSLYLIHILQKRPFKQLLW
jgi:hypothetical protein